MEFPKVNEQLYRCATVVAGFTYSFKEVGDEVLLNFQVLRLRRFPSFQMCLPKSTDSLA